MKLFPAWEIGVAKLSGIDFQMIPEGRWRQHCLNFNFSEGRIIDVDQPKQD